MKAGIGFAGCGELSHSHELVRDLSHGADDDQRQAVTPAGDNLGDPFNGFGAFDRGAAEFHHNHAHTFLKDYTRPTLRKAQVTKRKTHAPVVVTGSGS